MTLSVLLALVALLVVAIGPVCVARADQGEGVASQEDASTLEISSSMVSGV